MGAKCPAKVRMATLCLPLDVAAGLSRHWLDVAAGLSHHWAGYVAAGEFIPIRSGSRHWLVNNPRAYGVAEPRRAGHCFLPPAHCFEFPGFRVRVLLKGPPTQGGAMAGESPRPFSG